MFPVRAGLLVTPPPFSHTQGMSRRSSTNSGGSGTDSTTATKPTNNGKHSQGRRDSQNGADHKLERLRQAIQVFFEDQELTPDVPVERQAQQALDDLGAFSQLVVARCCSGATGGACVGRLCFCACATCPQGSWARQLRWSWCEHSDARTSADKGLS